MTGNERDYGRCPVCARFLSLRKDGSMWRHMGFAEGKWSSTCEGSGRKP